MTAATATYLSFNDKLSDSFAASAEDVEPEPIEDLPLHHTWSIWEQVMPATSGKMNQYSYSGQTHQVASFSSARQFWRLWNEMPQPSELLEQKRMVRETAQGLAVIDAVMIFKEGIKPEWEDPNNASGGHFQFMLKPSIGPAQIDEYWNNLVLGIIGGNIQPANMITGVRLVDKLSGPKTKGVIRLEVWFGNNDDQAAVNQLKKNVENSIATRLDGTTGEVRRSDIKSHTQKR